MAVSKAWQGAKLFSYKRVLAGTTEPDTIHISKPHISLSQSLRRRKSATHMSTMQVAICVRTVSS